MSLIVVTSLETLYITLYFIVTINTDSNTTKIFDQGPPEIQLTIILKLQPVGLKTAFVIVMAIPF